MWGAESVSIEMGCTDTVHFPRESNTPFWLGQLRVPLEPIFCPQILEPRYCYKDQLGVGQAIRQSGVPRADMFLVSKTPSGGGGPDAKGSAVLGYEETLALFNTSLAQLNQSYVDLFLMHWPVLLLAEPA